MQPLDVCEAQSGVLPGCRAGYFDLQGELRTEESSRLKSCRLNICLFILDQDVAWQEGASDRLSKIQCNTRTPPITRPTQRGLSHI